MVFFKYYDISPGSRKECPNLSVKHSGHFQDAFAELKEETMKMALPTCAFSSRGQLGRALESLTSFFTLASAPLSRSNWTNSP